MKDTSHLKIAWHSKRQKKKIGKRVRKTKNENNSITSITIFLLLLFYRKKIVLRKEKYLKKLSLCR